LINPVNSIDIHKTGQFYRVEQSPKVIQDNPELP